MAWFPPQDMSVYGTDFDRIREVLEDVDASEPLTARQIREILSDNGLEIASAHRVATILGRAARRGRIEVIEDQPYRYQLPD